MSLLLDTNILLPLIFVRPEALSGPVRALIEDRRTRLFFSVASVWEIAIKWRLGKLALVRTPETVPAFLDRLGFTMLDVTADHALVEIEPAPDTKDPFDRLLLGVCAVEGLRLVTTDRALGAHPLAWR